MVLGFHLHKFYDVHAINQAVHRDLYHVFFVLGAILSIYIYKKVAGQLSL